MIDAEGYCHAILGIDPGQKGALAFLAPATGAVLHLMTMPGICEFADIVDAAQPLAVYLEKAQSMPGQGVSSVFSYGDHFGQLQGVLIALEIRQELVPPRTWCAEMHAGTVGKLTGKEKSAIAAARLFPRVSLLATESSRKPHEGFIDALLIAEWGRRKWTQSLKGGA